MSTTVAPSPGELRLPSMPEMAERSLAGGLRARAARRSSVPLVEVRLGVRLPASVVTRPAAVLVLAESALAGTRLRNRQELADAVQRLGGRLSMHVEEDVLEVVASSLSARYDELLSLVGEVLLEARFPAAEVRSDRARVAEEVVIALSQPSVIADEALHRRMFGRHPYATGLPSPSRLERVGASTLRALYHEVLAPAGAHLAVVGDIEPDDAIARAAEALGVWLGSDVPAPEEMPALAPPAPGPFDLVDRPGALQSNIRIAGAAPRRDEEWWPAAALANLAFGGMFGSRLMANLRERKGYTYSPRSHVQHMTAGSALVVVADVGTDVTGPALCEVLYELGRTSTAGLEPREVEDARRYAVGTLALATATQGGLARSLLSLSLAGLPASYLVDHPAALAALGQDDVSAAAARMLAPAGMVGAIVGDASKVAPAIGRIVPVHVAS